jgi:hypothetical protein
MYGAQNAAPPAPPAAPAAPPPAPPAAPPVAPPVARPVARPPRGALRAISCARCIRSALAGRSTGECHDAVGAGQRCWNCASGHKCEPLPAAVQALAALLVAALVAPSPRRSVSELLGFLLFRVLTSLQRITRLRAAVRTAFEANATAAPVPAAAAAAPGAVPAAPAALLTAAQRIARIKELLGEVVDLVLG